jgi:hypothetical protein
MSKNKIKIFLGGFLNSTNAHNGFIVDDFFEVVDVVNRLVKEEKLLSIVSKGAYNMSLNFDWKK